MPARIKDRERLFEEWWKINEPFLQFTDKETAKQIWNAAWTAKSKQNFNNPHDTTNLSGSRRAVNDNVG